MGNDLVYFFLLPMFYWLLPKSVGVRLIVWVTIVLYGSEALKMWFHTARPIGQQGIRSLYEQSAPGYSFPSGHTLGATTFWGYLAATFRKRWLTAFAVLIVGAIACSRLYLGVHFPIDIVGGAVIGILIVAVAFLVDRLAAKRRLKIDQAERSVGASMLLAGMTLLVAAVLYGLAYNALQRRLMLFGAAALIGCIVENTWLRIEHIRRVWRRLAAVVIGGSVLLAVQTTLPTVVDAQGFRHGAVLVPILSGLWATLGAPVIFRLCGLEQSSR